VAIHKPPRMTPDVNAEGIVALIAAILLLSLLSPAVSSALPCDAGRAADAGSLVGGVTWF
jgi:hypothetical protein